MSESNDPVPRELITKGAAWLSGSGPESDVVISSRLRMARNLAGFPFCSTAKPDQRAAILDVCHDRLLEADLYAAMGEKTGEVRWLDVHKLASLDKTLLVERHLMSKEHAKGSAGLAAESEAKASASSPRVGPLPRGLAVTLPDESLSIMVNEEDHLRIQVLRSGLALGEALALIDAADDRIEAGLDYAFSPRFGYLTACPTNVGCGVRMSAMLHLPALKLTGEIDKVKRAARDMTLVVRGFYGEGSEATGDLFQISNQTALGKTESIILRELEKEILPQIVEYERAARRTLVEKRRRTLEDQVFRAWGTLKNARLLAPEEALTLLSMVRLGVLSGLIEGLPEQTVTQLFLLTQPAHLQRLVGQEMDQQRRREVRADLVRERLGGR